MGGTVPDLILVGLVRGTWLEPDASVPKHRRMSNPFGTFKTSSQIIRLGVMLYVRFLLSYRNAEILFHKLAAYVGYWQILWHCHINFSKLQFVQIGTKVRPPCSHFAKPRTMLFEALCTWAV